MGDSNCPVSYGTLVFSIGWKRPGRAVSAKPQEGSGKRGEERLMHAGEDTRGVEKVMTGSMAEVCWLSRIHRTLCTGNGGHV